jgi:hypothetical protein
MLIENLHLGIKIYYLDEAMFTTRTHYQRDYAPKYKNVTFGSNIPKPQNPTKMEK